MGKGDKTRKLRRCERQRRKKNRLKNREANAKPGRGRKASRKS